MSETILDQYRLKGLVRQPDNHDKHAYNDVFVTQELLVLDDENGNYLFLKHDRPSSNKDEHKYQRSRDFFTTCMGFTFGCQNEYLLIGGILSRKTLQSTKIINTSIVKNKENCRELEKRIM